MSSERGRNGYIKRRGKVRKKGCGYIKGIKRVSVERGGRDISREEEGCQGEKRGKEYNKERCAVSRQEGKSQGKSIGLYEGQSV